jgi:hypothetical protein
VKHSRFANIGDSPILSPQAHANRISKKDRMLLKGWLRAEWGTSETNRKARFYQLTKEGQKQLAAEAGEFNKLVTAIQLVMKSA